MQVLTQHEVRDYFVLLNEEKKNFIYYNLSSHKQNYD